MNDIFSYKEFNVMKEYQEIQKRDLLYKYKQMILKGNPNSSILKKCFS